MKASVLIFHLPAVVSESGAENGERKLFLNGPLIDCFLPKSFTAAAMQDAIFTTRVKLAFSVLAKDTYDIYELGNMENCIWGTLALLKLHSLHINPNT